MVVVVSYGIFHVLITVQTLIILLLWARAVLGRPSLQTYIHTALRKARVALSSPLDRDSSEVNMMCPNVSDYSSSFNENEFHLGCIQDYHWVLFRASRAVSVINTSTQSYLIPIK